MPSNALSQKKFSAKPPATCHPPPPPPALPIPRLINATFRCYAGGTTHPAGTPRHFQATATLRWNIAKNVWEGGSEDWAEGNGVWGTLSPNPLQPYYGLNVNYRFSGVANRIVWWPQEIFPDIRPYNGELLRKRWVAQAQYYNARVREIPP